MTTVGILTFSDGRAFVAEQVEEMNRGFQERLKRRLEADGQRVVTGEEIVWTNEGAVRTDAFTANPARCETGGSRRVRKRIGISQRRARRKPHAFQNFTRGLLADEPVRGSKESTGSGSLAKDSSTTALMIAGSRG